jgi:hypothetical protein
VNARARAPQLEDTMQFLLLIHGNENRTMSQPEREQMHAAYRDYTKEMTGAGIMRGGDALMPTEKGAKVSVREGKTRIVDGPFTEAKEVLGGYYLVDVATRDEAVKWAAKCPGALHGTMEVREVMNFK